MSNKKTTKREHFANLLTLAEVQDNKQLVDFINHEIELLEKKTGEDKKLTESQKENEVIKSFIYETMEENRLYTISEIQKAILPSYELSNQRTSAVIRQMTIDGKVERTEEKRKAFFSKI